MCSAGMYSAAVLRRCSAARPQLPAQGAKLGAELAPPHRPPAHSNTTHPTHLSPRTHSARPAACAQELRPYQQCGGVSYPACSSLDGKVSWCGDMAWRDRCCPRGYACARKGPDYWQCAVASVSPSPPSPKAPAAKPAPAPVPAKSTPTPAKAAPTPAPAANATFKGVSERRPRPAPQRQARPTPARLCSAALALALTLPPASCPSPLPPQRAPRRSACTSSAAASSRPRACRSTAGRQPTAWTWPGQVRTRALEHWLAGGFAAGALPGHAR
jgi:hypothetical protein